MKVLFWVQHLLGIGHVRRAAVIAEALRDAGAKVTLAAGGFPVPGVEPRGIDRLQLPPVRAAGADFSALIDETGRPIDDAWRQRRAAALMRAFDDVGPDILLTESFPLGRRAFRFELLPVLEAAHRRRRPPLIAASVRDILVRKAQPAKEEQMADLGRRWYHRILVHGDPALVSLDATFPPAGRIADLVAYTGYVAPDRPIVPAPEGVGAGEVIVSVGGGAVGETLLRTALAARPLSALAERPWRLLAGPDLSESIVGELAGLAGNGIVVERARPDFPDLLNRAALSISQAGYNTVLDILSAGCRAVLVPFAAGQESEQALRAGLLADRGLVQVLAEADLTPARLATAASEAMAQPAPGRAGFRRNGGAETAHILVNAVSRG